MIPGYFPLQIYKGDTYRYEFRLWTDIQKTLPTDLTDATAKAEIRDRPGGTVITSFVCSVTLPNVISAVLDAADCAKLYSNAVWDLQVTFGSGDVATVLSGQVNVTPDVTDSTVVAVPVGMIRAPVSIPLVRGRVRA